MVTERVLIQGKRHSFHDQAAELFGIGELQRESVESHAELFRLLKSRAHGRAVTAVVNTTKGRIEGSYEHIMLGSEDWQIIGKVNLPIRLPLYGLKQTRKDRIRYIHTQSHAKDQCLKLWRDMFPQAEWVEEYDTAASASVVSKLNSPEHAAITPHQAGKQAGLVCLQENIQGEHPTITSFYLLGRGCYAQSSQVPQVLVVALRRSRLTHAQSPDQLSRTLRQAGVTLLHVADLKQDSLLAEIKTNKDPTEVLAKTRRALQGLYSMTHLGGYTPL